MAPILYHFQRLLQAGPSRFMPLVKAIRYHGRAENVTQLMRHSLLHAIFKRMGRVFAAGRLILFGFEGAIMSWGRTF